MSRMLKPVLAGLAISSLCLAFAADLSAQSGTKQGGTNQSGTKKSGTIKRVQAEDDDVEPPRTAPRNRPSADDDEPDDAAPASPRKGAKQPRPEALPPMRIEKLSPELEKILAEWELHTSRFKIMTGEFTRFKYDKTFEVEWRTEGKFIYEAPDKGDYQLSAYKLEKGVVSKKKGKDGTPYQVKSGEPERWVCNGKKVIRINDKEKTYEEAAIPPENQGQNIIDGPLPFLFGMKADKAKRRYRLALSKRDETEIWLDVVPRTKTDAGNWTKATVIIEAKTFKPRAVKLLDPTGAESVHVFRNIVINEKRGIFDKDPFKPSLRGYKLVLNDKSPAVDEKPIPPATSKQSKAPTGKARSSANDGSELDLGRTADSALDNPPRKNAGSTNR